MSTGSWTNRLKSRFNRQSDATTTMVTLVGKSAIVTKHVMPHELSGKVKIGTQIWSATSDDEIEEGKEVMIIKAEGVHVVVKEKTEDDDTKNTR